MKKYLMTGIAALAMCAGFTSCSHDLEAPSQEEINEVNAQKVTETYNRAFIAKFGQPAADQDWGFGTASNARALTRSQHSPTVYSISAPYDEAWVANYLTTAKEPDNQNTSDNYDNSSYAINYNTGGVNDIDWNDEEQTTERTYFFSLSWDDQIKYAQEHHPNWITYNADETFVLNFKITSTYSGGISVAATEGSTYPGAERTIVVTGTWNITEDQKIGSLGKIIIANGGTVNVASGKTLSMVNQAQLVVLDGGTITGAGKVEVSNGNEAGYENYNAGTFSVATFNNNFGQFYNYGVFNVTEYQGGSQKSNFFNHATAVVDHFSSTANARIYNNCSFVVTHDARIRNYEGSTGSSLVVGGELLFSSSEDGSGDPTYVGLASGALVKCATLYNQGTSWSGPSSGNAALEITDKITYLNWEQDAPQNGGYFEGNILVRAGTWDNVPDGNGYHQTDPSDAANYALSIADYKFWNIVANCTSNKGVKKVSTGNTVAIASSECTPGFTYGDPDPDPDPEYETRIIGEDLTPGDTDWDFNDVVFAVEFSGTTANCTLLAAGGTLPLRIYTVANEQNPEQNFVEVHELFGVNTNVMVNTGGISTTVDKKPTFSVTGVDSSKRGKDIIIRVNKGTSDKPNWVELKAEKGDPAAKLAVSKNFKVCTERQNINTVYTRFSDWVADKGVIWY